MPVADTGGSTIEPTRLLAMTHPRTESTSSDLKHAIISMIRCLSWKVNYSGWPQEPAGHLDSVNLLAHS